MMRMGDDHSSAPGTGAGGDDRIERREAAVALEEEDVMFAAMTANLKDLRRFLGETHCTTSTTATKESCYGDESNAGSRTGSSSSSRNEALPLTSPQSLRGRKSLLCQKVALEWTPLHAAAAMGHSDTVSYLVEMMRKEANDDGGASTMKIMLNTTDLHGRLPLHWACQGGYLDIASLLLFHGARQPPKSLAKPLENANDSRDGNAKGDTEIDVSTEPNNKAAIMTALTQQDHRGRTALHLACVSNSVDMVRFLLAAAAAAKPQIKAGCDGFPSVHDPEIDSLWNICDSNGHTPLDLARQMDCSNVLEAFEATMRQEGNQSNTAIVDRNKDGMNVQRGKERTHSLELSRLPQEGEMEDIAKQAMTRLQRDFEKRFAQQLSSAISSLASGGNICVEPCLELVERFLDANEPHWKVTCQDVLAKQGFFLERAADQYTRLVEFLESTASLLILQGSRTQKNEVQQVHEWAALEKRLIQRVVRERILGHNHAEITSEIRRFQNRVRPFIDYCSNILKESEFMGWQNEKEVSRGCSEDTSSSSQDPHERSPAVPFPSAGTPRPPLTTAVQQQQIFLGRDIPLDGSCVVLGTKFTWDTDAIPHNRRFKEFWKNVVKETSSSHKDQKISADKLNTLYDHCAKAGYTLYWPKRGDDGSLPRCSMEGWRDVPFAKILRHEAKKALRSPFKAFASQYRKRENGRVQDNEIAAASEDHGMASSNPLSGERSTTSEASVSRLGDKRVQVGLPAKRDFVDLNQASEGFMLRLPEENDAADVATQQSKRLKPGTSENETEVSSGTSSSHGAKPNNVNIQTGKIDQEENDFATNNDNCRQQTFLPLPSIGEGRMYAFDSEGPVSLKEVIREKDIEFNKLQLDQLLKKDPIDYDDLRSVFIAFYTACHEASRINKSFPSQLYDRYWKVIRQCLSCDVSEDEAEHGAVEVAHPILTCAHKQWSKIMATCQDLKERLPKAVRENAVEGWPDLQELSEVTVKEVVFRKKQASLREEVNRMRAKGMENTSPLDPEFLRHVARYLHVPTLDMDVHDLDRDVQDLLKAAAETEQVSFLSGDLDLEQRAEHGNNTLASGQDDKAAAMAGIQGSCIPQDGSSFIFTTKLTWNLPHNRRLAKYMAGICDGKEGSPRATSQLIRAFFRQCLKDGITLYTVKRRADNGVRPTVTRENWQEHLFVPVQWHEAVDVLKSPLKTVLWRKGAIKQQQHSSSVQREVWRKEETKQQHQPSSVHFVELDDSFSMLSEDWEEWEEWNKLLWDDVSDVEIMSADLGFTEPSYHEALPPGS